MKNENGTVMVVDDDPGIRNAMRILLRTVGLECRLFASAQEFLDAYEAELGRHCAPFPGVEPMLAALEADGVRWGIVTNKP